MYFLSAQPGLSCDFIAIAGFFLHVVAVAVCVD